MVLTLPTLPAGVVVADLWVFDYFVVVQYTNKNISFFEKPLIMGGAMSPYRLINNSTAKFNSTSFFETTLKTWDISISPDNDTSVFYFGVT